MLLKKIIKNVLGIKAPTADVKKDWNVELIAQKKIIVGKNNIISNLKVEIRNGVDNKTYLKIGNDNVINGTFVFETNKGEFSIGDDCFIGGGLFICIEGIEIGNDVMFSWGCTVMDNNAHSLRWSERAGDVRDWKRGLDENKLGFYKDWTNVKTGKIIIKDKAWIGFNSIILKGVTIGEGAVVAAGSVVLKDVPDWTVVGGNPAQVIREIPLNQR